MTSPLETLNPNIPAGAFNQPAPFTAIARKWIAYAQQDGDSNDIAAAIWSAVQETRNQMALEQGTAMASPQ